MKEQKVRWVHSTFVDMRGLLQDMIVPAREYADGDAFKMGLSFDGSSVRGFKPIDESDMNYMPDPKTLAILPWVTDENQKSAIILGDVHEAYGGGLSEVCPRSYVAKRAVKAAEEMGYDVYVAPELEYFLFSSIDPTQLVWDLWVSPKGGKGDSWGPPRVMPQSPETTPGNFVLRPMEAYYRPPPEYTTIEYRNEVSSILEDYFGLRN
ncbi:MAG: glutamine synthetase beta-grasp domain-containing protein [Candidatus Bathyarchaeia archaeon]